MSSNVLAARDLGVSLGGRHVVDGATLSVSPGEFVGLLGPNGAGKTTLLRALLGLVPASGQRELTGLAGYVPQRHEFAWDFPITVGRCVVGGRTGLHPWRRPTRADYRAAAEALEAVGLTELARRPIAALSGGQRQRVLIARALATHPDVLLLDEPFTGLDAPTTESLLALFQALSLSGTAIVMSTHNLIEAAHACPRLVLFRRRVLADGPTRTVLADAAAWTDAFGVGVDSPLLAAVGVGA